MKVSKSYNVQIWCGLKAGYTGSEHSFFEAKAICEKFVDEEKDCVSITPTSFSYVDGKEMGVVVGFINYPRFPKKKKEIRSRAFKLANLLMEGLGQNRVTVTTPKKNYMFESSKVK